jgi:hypothetical protein
MQKSAFKIKKFLAISKEVGIQRPRDMDKFMWKLKTVQLV